MPGVYLLASTEAPSLVRYVGMTKHDTPAYRLESHKRGARSANARLPVYRWIKKTLANGFDVVVVSFLPTETVEEAWQLEVELIASFRLDGASLLNIASGGRGAMNAPITDEMRESLRRGHVGRVTSAEHRAAISRALAGRTLSDKMKQRISETLQGRKLSEEHRRAISDGQMGRPLSEAHRTAIGNAHRGKFVSDETKEKLRAAATGKTLSPEAKQKISAVHKGKKVL
jgi:hypothetical protein